MDVQRAPHAYKVAGEDQEVLLSHGVAEGRLACVVCGNADDLLSQGVVGGVLEPAGGGPAPVGFACVRCANLLRANGQGAGFTSVAKHSDCRCLECTHPRCEEKSDYWRERAAWLGRRQQRALANAPPGKKAAIEADEAYVATRDLFATENGARATHVPARDLRALGTAGLMSGYRVGTGGVEMTDAAGVALRDQNKTYCYDYGLKDPIRMAPIHKKCCFPCMLAGYPDHTATRTTAGHMPICWLCDQDWYEPGGFSPPLYVPSHPRVPFSYRGDPLDPRPGEPARDYCARFFLHKRRRFQEVVRLAGHRKRWSRIARGRESRRVARAGLMRLGAWISAAELTVRRLQSIVKGATHL